jgi:hypothetical protein
MKLPGGERAIVDIGKLRDYCLSMDHFRGRHKARVFASVLGITSADGESLREDLLRAAREQDATQGRRDDYGMRYIIDLDVQRGHRRAKVRSAWIVLRSESAPRFAFLLCTIGLKAPWLNSQRFPSLLFSRIFLRSVSSEAKWELSSRVLHPKCTKSSSATTQAEPTRRLRYVPIK